MNNRISRDHMLMLIAQAVAARSTCSRLHVGAVISRDFRTIATGYNGVPSGLEHCDHAPPNTGPCVYAVHAEANAICFAARMGVEVDGAELVTTHMPCNDCAKLIINSGISRVMFMNAYRDANGVNLMRRAGVAVERFGG